MTLDKYRALIDESLINMVDNLHPALKEDVYNIIMDMQYTHTIEQVNTAILEYLSDIPDECFNYYDDVYSIVD